MPWVEKFFLISGAARKQIFFGCTEGVHEFCAHLCKQVWDNHLAPHNVLCSASKFNFFSWCTLNKHALDAPLIEDCGFRHYYRFFFENGPWPEMFYCSRTQPGNSCDLSDPRNRNHKSLAIGNHNFKVASFSRRNRSKIAVSQSQKSHWAKKIAAIQNHTLVVATYSGGGFQTHVALLKHYKNHTKLAVPESKELVSEGVFGVAVIFLSCDCSR